MHYQYAIDIVAEDGRQLERMVVDPDWGAALEWARFEGIRQGFLPPVTGTVPGVIEPIWDRDAGQPIVGGFRAVVRAGDGGEFSREIPKTYVRGAVQQATEKLTERGVVKAGDLVHYVISAFPASRAAMAVEPPADGFSIEEMIESLPLVEAPLDEILGGAERVGAEEPAGRIPVFLPRRVLDEAIERAREAGDVETGGVLVGRLCRDSGPRAGAVPEIFVEVTAQIPAPHTLSQSTKLTFTADTWAAVQAALTLRRRNEMMIGWWHFHPDFCRLRDCPPERRARCAGASPFFSAEDVHLHATCFPSAYHVALLVSDSTPAGMTWSLYGWSHGMVGARDFFIVTDDGPKGGSLHATYAAIGT